MAKAQILIVEDESIVAEDIKDILKDLGYAVLGIATSGEEAIKKAAGTHPDLVMMDIVLKGNVDGVEAAEQIRALLNIPVVYLTAYSDEDTLRRAKITEPYGYILKPFEERELHTAIEIALYKHKMENRLRESERWLATTLKSIGDAVIATDERGCITFMNPVAETLTGWKEEEAIGRGIEDIFKITNEKTRGMVENPVVRVLREGIIAGLANHSLLLAKDGTEKPIDDSGAPIRDDSGNIVGVVLVFHDITERRQAEEALQRSEEKYRTLFEESKDVVFISTPEGKFVDINPAGVELFGYSSKEEIININISNDLYFNPQDRERYRQAMTEHGFVKNFEITLKTKDGQQVIAVVTATAVRDVNGAVIAYRGIMRDITGRKRLEEQLLHAQKMEALGQFAGGIAHDFNNILTAIVGYGKLLQDKMEKDDPTKHYLDQILSSSERAANLTQSLLAFSRKQIMELRPVNLNEVTRRVENFLLRLIGEDIELFTVFAEEDLTVMADSSQIEQLLMNLAANARDAMPDGGSLNISTDLVKLDNEFIKMHGYGRQGFYALITVEDTGEGMDEKTRERIFEPFFTTKEVGKGTGLGLAMVYGIIKQHDGYINCYSELGKGTTFKIYLPLIKSKVEEIKPADPTTLKGGAETILIAEDDAHVRDLTKEVLTEFGYRVIEAMDGEDAIKVFHENKDKIQLLILDVIMPKKNGKEVYDEIKKVKPDVKAIFTSGYTGDIVHKRGIVEEGLGFILKPITPQRLLRKVREILDSGR